MMSIICYLQFRDGSISCESGSPGWNWSYRLVDKYTPQRRLKKSNITNIDEDYLSSDLVLIASVYFLNVPQLSLKYAIQFFLINTPQNLLQRFKE
jgi:hypothetical protein